MHLLMPLTSTGWSETKKHLQTAWSSVNVHLSLKLPLVSSIHSKKNLYDLSFMQAFCTPTIPAVEHVIDEEVYEANL